ncbi:MAG: response regulator [Verrucomicrobia bacterium]|nr:response regulator [Verrucomicrobiota bacterium]
MPKILIIEDDSIIANIYRSRLEKEGYNVDIALDGQSGFYRAYEFQPDAILLDLMLPKMDGIQILRKIKAQKKFERTPVIVFTNAYIPNMIDQSLEAGATNVFNKASLTPRQIIDALNNAVFKNLPHNMPGSTQRSGLDTPTKPREHGAGTTPAPQPHQPPQPQQTQQPSQQPPRQPRWGRPILPGQTRAPFPRQTPPKPTPSPSAPPPSPQADDDFQSDLIRTFKQTLPETMNGLRRLIQGLMRNNNEAIRKQHLLDLYKKVHAVTGNAAIVGLGNISQLCSAFEALLKELHDKPRSITSSTLRTVAQSVDFLGLLFDKDDNTPLLQSPEPNILVVDDEVISRRAVTYALEKAKLNAESIEDPTTADGLVKEKPYDLIILDVDMPEIDGFELCKRLRAGSLNNETPVVFVTGLTDFESRAQSSLSGGNDLIAKPFLFIELAVKALTFIMKHRLSKKDNAGGRE